MRPIDADALIEKCGGWYVEEGTESGFIGTLENLLATEPTMQPERKMGKWTLGFDNIYMEKYYYCSRCGCRKYGRHEPIDYFCSNCGAKMKGERQE